VSSRTPRGEIVAGGFEALVDPGRGELKVLVEVNRAPRAA